MVIPAGSVEEAEEDGNPEASRSGSAGVERRMIWVVLPVAVAAVLLMIVLATRDSAWDRRISSPLLGKLTPTLTGITAAGDTFDIDDWRGRWVIVNFFSTTCVPCVMEHPELVDFSERHTPADDARIVSVVFGDTASNVKGFFAKHGGDWPVLTEGSVAAAISYGVTGVPESYLVAPSGLVVWKQIGGVEADAIDNVIARLEAAA